MDYPVYVLDTGEEVPLPGSEVHLIVPTEKIPLFNTTFISIGTQPEPIRRLALAIAKRGDPFDLMTDENEYMDSVHEIGVIATVCETEETDDFLLATLKIEGRAYVNLEIMRGVDEEYPDQVWTRTQLYLEEFSQDEKSIVNDIEALCKVIPKNKELFKPELGELVMGERSLIRRMDYIANYVLQNNNKRLTYLQEASNLDRWILVTTQISELVEHLPSNREKPPAKEVRIAAPPKKGAEPPKPAPSWQNLSFKEKFELTPIPPALRDRVSEEINKLEQMSGNTTESGMLRDYLNWIFQIPWGKTSRRELDLKDLRSELDVSHYGLSDVKDYLVEHMCIEQLKGTSSGAVICLVGPPGTGKSSIAKALAKSSGRQFQSMALGGITDEAEIRGHRRTYIASRPGRLINALKNAGTMDPVILLDEVDKIESARGSPTAALLELLDPEQNHAFVDRYMELEIDLSHVLFICTANYEEQIPAPLVDRMEMIRFREYTEEERQVILRSYILPKITQDYNIANMDIDWGNEVLDKLATVKQVRQIEKKARRLLRMAATNIHVHKRPAQKIDMSFAGPIIGESERSRRLIGFCREDR
jgi:ATP-dependent Lon protease